MRLVMFVSLRMAASAVTPLSLIAGNLSHQSSSSLRARGKMETMRQ